MTATVAMSTPLLDAHLLPDQLELLETTSTVARERMAPLARQSTASPSAIPGSMRYLRIIQTDPERSLLA